MSFSSAVMKRISTLTLPVNKQNNRMWESSSPYDVIEKPLNDMKILALCTITAKFIFGPIAINKKTTSS